MQPSVEVPDLVETCSTLSPEIAGTWLGEAFPKPGYHAVEAGPNDTVFDAVRKAEEFQFPGYKHPTSTKLDIIAKDWALYEPPVYDPQLLKPATISRIFDKWATKEVQQLHLGVKIAGGDATIWIDSMSDRFFPLKTKIVWILQHTDTPNGQYRYSALRAGTAPGCDNGTPRQSNENSEDDPQSPTHQGGPKPFAKARGRSKSPLPNSKGKRGGNICQSRSPRKGNSAGASSFFLSVGKSTSTAVAGPLESHTSAFLRSRIVKPAQHQTTTRNMAEVAVEFLRRHQGGEYGGAGAALLERKRECGLDLGLSSMGGRYLCGPMAKVA